MKDPLDIVRKCIALAGSDKKGEAEVAAMKACALIREHKFLVVEAGSRPGEAAAHDPKKHYYKPAVGGDDPYGAFDLDALFRKAEEARRRAPAPPPPGPGDPAGGYARYSAYAPDPVPHPPPDDPFVGVWPRKDPHHDPFGFHRPDPFDSIKDMGTDSLPCARCGKRFFFFAFARPTGTPVCVECTSKTVSEPSCRCGDASPDHNADGTCRLCACRYYTPVTTASCDRCGHLAYRHMFGRGKCGEAACHCAGFMHRAATRRAASYHVCATCLRPLPDDYADRRCRSCLEHEARGHYTPYGPTATMPRKTDAEKRREDLYEAEKEDRRKAKMKAEEAEVRRKADEKKAEYDRAREVLEHLSIKMGEVGRSMDITAAEVEKMAEFMRRAAPPRRR